MIKNLPDDTWVSISIGSGGLTLQARNKGLLFAASAVTLLGIGSLAVWPLLIGYFAGGLLR